MGTKGASREFLSIRAVRKKEKEWFTETAKTLGLTESDVFSMMVTEFKRSSTGSALKGVTKRRAEALSDLLGEK